MCRPLSIVESVPAGVGNVEKRWATAGKHFFVEPSFLGRTTIAICLGCCGKLYSQKKMLRCFLLLNAIDHFDQNTHVARLWTILYC